MNRDEIVIESTDGIHKVLSVLTDIARSHKYVFRGYGKQSELLPNLIREKTKYDDVEEALLKNFEKYGSHYFKANTPIDLVSCAQHFGLPTRLLDFTYNPFIALSFALYTDKSNGTYSDSLDKEYYYIRYAAIEENIILNSILAPESYLRLGDSMLGSFADQACATFGYLTNLFSGKPGLQRNVREEAQHLLSCSSESFSLAGIDFLEEKINSRKILFVDPNQANQRIIMQQGLFMLPYTLDEKEHRQILSRNSSVIKIHQDLRRELLQYLDTLGFNAFRLMPDLTNVCSAVRNKVVDERKEKRSIFKKKKAF